MVTGKTVAAAPDVLARLRDRTDVDLVVGEPDSDGISELTGSSAGWTQPGVGAGGHRLLHDR